MAGQALDIQVRPRTYSPPMISTRFAMKSLRRLDSIPTPHSRSPTSTARKKAADGEQQDHGPLRHSTSTTKRQGKQGRLQAIINVRVGEATLCEIPSDGFEYARAQFTCGEQAIPAVRQVPYQPPAAQASGASSRPARRPASRPARAASQSASQRPASRPASRPTRHPRWPACCPPNYQRRPGRPP